MTGDPEKVAQQEWSVDDISFLRKWYGERGGVWCAEELGREKKKVYTKARSLGLRKYKKTHPRITVLYSLPDCPKCTTLKEWLKAREIKFSEKIFDVDAQLNMLMRNVYDDPPILKMRNAAVIGSGASFDEYTIRESVVAEFISKNLGRAFPSAWQTHVYCRKCGEWVWKYFAGDRCTSCGSLFRKEPYRRKKGVTE